MDGVMASWWPAAVSLPDGTAIARARVYVTGDGDVEVYDQPSATPRFVGRLDFRRTPTPPAEQSWPRPSIDLHTADGLIVVQPTGGCGCSNRLHQWKPPGASRLVPWRAVV